MYDNMCVKIMEFKKVEWDKFKQFLKDNDFEVSTDFNAMKTKEYFSWSNLRIEYYPISEQVWIRNSLHVFFNDSISEMPIGKQNYNDFTVNNVTKTVKYLSLFFGRPLVDFELFGKVEYGVNIITSPYNPSKIINSYVSISNTSINMFHAMSPKEGRVYGVKCYFSEYNFKIYNKTKQAEIQKKNIMRLECQSQVNRIKRICNVKRLTFEEIIQKKFLKIFENEFLNMYDNILKLPINQNVEREDFKELLMISTEQGMDYDKNYFSRYKRAEQRKKYKSIMKQYSEDPKSIHYWLKSKIETKLTNLIS